MTLSEFKYWIEGLEESFVNDRPSDLQWKKIREKLDSVTVVKPSVPTEGKFPLLPTDIYPRIKY